MGTFPSEDASNNVGVSLALRSFVEVGLGATSKWIASDLGGHRGVSQGARLRYHGGGTRGWSPEASHRPRACPGSSSPAQAGHRLRHRLAQSRLQDRLAQVAAPGSRRKTDPLPANRRHGWSGQPRHGLAVRRPPDHDRERDLGDGDLPSPDRGCPRPQALPTTTRGDSRCRSSRRSPSAEASTTTSMVRSTSRPRDGPSGPTACSGTWRTTWRAHRPAPPGTRCCSSPGTCRSAGPGSSTTTTRHGSWPAEGHSYLGTLLPITAARRQSRLTSRRTRPGLSTAR